MTMNLYQTISLPVLFGTLTLTACGGGGGVDGAPPAPDTLATTVISSSAVKIPAATYPPESAEAGGWTILQTARTLCGFGTLRQDARLDAAALSHANYLTSESLTTPGLLSHEESNTSNQNYTGRFPWDRTIRSGYGDQVAEILEAISQTYTVGNPPVPLPMSQRGAFSMIDLLNTVYHQQGAMFDGLDVGFGADLRTFVNGTSARDEYRFGSLNGFQTRYHFFGAGRVATYPCQGSINVPTAFAPAFESPNPFPTMTSPLQVVGPPIYLKADFPQVLTLTSGTISGAGAVVPTTVLTRANDPARDDSGQPFIGNHEAFVVPTAALRANTDYQVTLAGTVNGVAFNRSFSFRTEP